MRNNEKKIEDTLQNNFSIKWSFKLEHKGLSQENFVNKSYVCAVMGLLFWVIYMHRHCT